MLKSKILEKEKEKEYKQRKNPPVYKEYFIFIKDTSSIYTTVHEILNNTYYNLLINSGTTFENIKDNHIEYAVKFINNINEYYNDPSNRSFFDSPYFEQFNSASNFILSGIGIDNDKYPYDKTITVYEYFLLLKKILKMYNSCFDIDYSKTCIKYDGMNNRITEFPKSNVNFNNILLNASGVYFRYIKNILNVKNDELDKIEPLFMGSYMVNNLCNSILCIYNICSSISKINKSLEKLNNMYNYEYKKYSNGKIFKDMLNFFDILKSPQCDTYALCVVTTNPSFEKATLLYYNAGFKPMINLFETNNQNMVDMMYGECIEGQDKNKYINCVEERHRNMLMMCTKGNYSSILYFNENNKLNKDIIKRNDVNFPYFSGVENFYSMTLAFSYKCSCILETFLNKNQRICEYNIQAITDYYNINNQENRLITDINNNTFFSYSNVYIDGVNNITFRDTITRDTVNNEQSLYRFIGSFTENLICPSNIFSSDILVLDTISFIIIDDGDGTTVFFRYNIFVTKDKINSQSVLIPYSGYIYEDIINKDINIVKYLNTEIKTQFKPMKYIDIILSNLNIDKNKQYKYIFIPSNAIINCTNEKSKYKTKELRHSFSYLYDVENKILYYYETQRIHDKIDPYALYAIKETTKVIKTILKYLKYEVLNDVNNFFEEQDNLTDLSKYYSPNETPIYCKIQNDFADDQKGTLCKLLSFLPIIGAGFMKHTKHRDRNIRFFMWFLYFSSIIIRQKQKNLKIDFGLRSNIHYAFPYIFSLVYDMIRNLNNIKRMSGGKYNLKQEDIYIENQLQINKNLLLDNIEELNRLISNEIYYSIEEGGFLSFKKTN
jgi:hypothetical protein